MSHNRIFHSVQNTIQRLDFIYVLPLAPTAHDARKGIARFARWHRLSGICAAISDEFVRAGHGIRSVKLFSPSRILVRPKGHDGRNRYGEKYSKFSQEKTAGSGFTIAVERST
jgi:hypothetical protein